MEFEQTVLRENQWQFVEDVEAQGREFLATSETEPFMELVILEEQAERVITGEDYQRLAYLWALQRHIFSRFQRNLSVSPFVGLGCLRTTHPHLRAVF